MIMKNILLLLILTNLLFGQNVIIVVIDGARYSETFGAGSTYIPHMYNDMRPLGAVYTNFRIADEGKTETNPGHSSILSGTWQQIANDGSQRPTKPTAFEYFRQQLGSSVTDNYDIAGKSKLNILSYSTDVNYGSSYGASTRCTTLTDNQVYNNLVSIMENNHSRLMIVNFPDTDIKGHSDNWNNYLAAITNADNLIYQLWQKINTDAFYQNNTTLFVTNDHGRHTTDFTSHGDDCEGCEHIMLLAIGKDIPSGFVDSNVRYQIDLSPTTGDLLGFSTPQAVGTSLFQGTNPLPVELSSLNAFVSGKSIKLEWTTKTEINNLGFEVERTSTALGMKWEKIGFVMGNGNSNSIKNYSFIDKNPSGSDKLVYRLKQIDTDGMFQYSEKVEVAVIPSEYTISQNYPNPFNPSTTISYTLPSESEVKLVILNALGETIEVVEDNVKSAGLHEINFYAGNLSSGIYFYSLIAKSNDGKNEFRSVKKMLLLK
jgi:hypothetical protein